MKRTLLAIAIALAGGAVSTAQAAETAATEHLSLSADAEVRERELAERETARHEAERLWKARRMELAEKKQLHLEVVEDHVEHETQHPCRAR